MTFIACYWTQLLASIVACLSTVSDGLHGSWTSPVLPKLLAADSPIPIDHGDVDMLELIYLIGGISGLPFTMWSVEKFGRKYTVVIAAASNCLTWLLIAFANNVYILHTARFLGGFNSNVAFVSVPMYIAEMADKEIRGFLVSLIYTMLLIGYIVCYSVAPFVSISALAFVGFTIVLTQLIVFPFLPETPYYHLLQHKEESAHQSLVFFRRGRSKDAIAKELEELKAAVERQSKESGRLKDVFQVRSNRRGLIIMTVLNASQHLAASMVIIMKLHTILGGTEAFLTPNMAAILFGIIMFIAAIISGSVVDRFGRKALLIGSSLSTTATLAALASYMMFVNMKADVSGVTWLPITAVFIFAAVYRLGLGSVPIVVTGELFPTSVKALAMTMSDAMYVISGTLVMYMFQRLDHTFGMHVPFFLFAVSCAGTALFTYFYIPETKGKTLEQIQLMLKGCNENEVTDEAAVQLQTILPKS